MGGFCLLVELHREGFAPTACAAGLFTLALGNIHSTICRYLATVTPAPPPRAPPLSLCLPSLPSLELVTCPTPPLPPPPPPPPGRAGNFSFSSYSSSSSFPSSSSFSSSASSREGWWLLLFLLFLLLLLFQGHSHPVRREPQPVGESEPELSLAQKFHFTPPSPSWANTELFGSSQLELKPARPLALAILPSLMFTYVKSSLC